MLTQMKKPLYSGFGRRNNTVEALRVARTLKQAADEIAAQKARTRPQALPMAPAQRSLHYIAQTGRRVTPAQRRRADKKGFRFKVLVGSAIDKVIGASGWHSRGSDASTAVDESREFGA